MSSHDRPEATAAASAPAREPEQQRPAAPRGTESGTTTMAGPASGGAQTQPGRRHERQRRRHRSGGGGGERETPPHAPQGRQQHERELNLDELRELSELINEQGFTEFEIEREGFRLRISKQTFALPHVAVHPQSAAPQPFVAPTVTPSAPPPAASAVDGTTTAPPPDAASGPQQPGAGEELHKITSPIVGTFYRAASPTAEPFVQIGSRVGPDTVVCIIEAMKLMNEIQAETTGTVAEVYVEDGQPVEFGQALFGIKNQ